MYNKFKNYFEYKISNKDYLIAAFPDGHLPKNAFINKGRCGIGGTTMELEDKSRNTIIIVPQKGIIENKQDEHGFILPVDGDVSVQDVIGYLEKDLPFKKIMSTPDSFYKIIAAAQKSETFGGVKKLYETFFLLIDECHSLVTETFRPKITEPFRYFWEFDHKSLISATPFEFSDPLMQTLEYHKIIFYEDYLGKVWVCEAPYIDGYINHILTNGHAVPGNVHIFFNSVTEISKAINQANLPDCNIYCAYKEENMETMGELKQYYKAKPVKGDFKKFNFYTSRYFEGIDIEDKNATVILVTDVHKPHTKVGITNKGVQAIGRVRTSKESSIYQIIHVTNHRNINSMKPTEVFRKEFKFHAEDGIESYNTYLKECKKQGFKPSKDRTELVKKYAFVDEQTKEEAILSPIKVDQHVNEATYNEEFNHIDNIHEAWEQAGYETVKGRVSLKLKKEKSNNGKSKRLGFQETILNIHELHKHKDEFIFTYGDTLTKAKKEHPEEFDIYTKLGMEKIEELEFNRKAISKEQIRIKELDAETKLLMLLAIEFTVGECYTKGFIKMKLQECYNIVGITSRKATAEQLGEKGRFEIKECKIWKNGKLVSGFRIIRQQFNLKMVV